MKNKIWTKKFYQWLTSFEENLDVDISWSERQTLSLAKLGFLVPWVSFDDIYFIITLINKHAFFSFWFDLWFYFLHFVCIFILWSTWCLFASVIPKVKLSAFKNLLFHHIHDFRQWIINQFHHYEISSMNF